MTCAVIWEFSLDSPPGVSSSAMYVANCSTVTSAICWARRGSSSVTTISISEVLSTTSAYTLSARSSGVMSRLSTSITRPDSSELRARSAYDAARFDANNDAA